MTDPPTPITDEDLSAHLDGEAAPDVAARIAADPGAQARLEALRGAARGLAESPVAPLDASTLDRLVTRALEKGTAAEGGPATLPAGTPPRGLSPTGPSPFAAIGDVSAENRPAAPPRARRLPPTWLVAAGVALVVALGIGLVVTGRDRGRNDRASRSAAELDARPGTTASPSLEGPSSNDAAAAKADHGVASGAAPSTTLGLAFGADRVLDLGTFASPDALRSSLAAGFPAASAPLPSGGVPATAALQRCGTQVAVTLNLKGEPLHVGYGTVAGRQVLVYEYPSTSYADKAPTTLVAAVGTQACDPVITFQR